MTSNKAKRLKVSSGGPRSHGSVLILLRDEEGKPDAKQAIAWLEAERKNAGTLGEVQFAVALATLKVALGFIPERVVRRDDDQ